MYCINIHDTINRSRVHGWAGSKLETLRSFYLSFYCALIIVHFYRASSSLLSEPNSEATEEAETDMGLREWLEDINVIVYLLVMTFAIASWIDINGVWVELPLLVEVLPEGWDLPSYLVMIIQIANVGPIAYTLASHFCSQRVKEWPVVYLIIAIGTVSCLLMSFFWDKTTFINGKEHSTPLLTLTAFLALVDCTSSVVFLPYMASFKPQYLTAFYVGEGLSGLIPGIVGLIQGVGSDPQCLNRSEIIYNETTGENSTIWEVISTICYCICYWIFIQVHYLTIQ